MLSRGWTTDLPESPFKLSYFVLVWSYMIYAQFPLKQATIVTRWMERRLKIICLHARLLQVITAEFSSLSCPFCSCAGGTEFPRYVSHEHPLLIHPVLWSLHCLWKTACRQLSECPSISTAIHHFLVRKYFALLIVEEKKLQHVELQCSPSFHT